MKSTFKPLQKRISKMRRVLFALIVLVGNSTAALTQASGEIELNLVRVGEQWTGEAKIITGGQQLLSPMREIKVSTGDISFTINILQAELHFNGKLSGDSFSGSIRGSQEGSNIGMGIWSLARQGLVNGAEPLAGTWFGTFTLQASTQPSTQPAPSDLVFNANVAHPAYAKRHPIVLFDAAHNNETPSGSYKPFADLISSDGYKVVLNNERFSRKALTHYEVLVIANASGGEAERGASPFTEEECEAVRDWVSGGGALLLITDHGPFSSAAAKLSKKFDLDLTIGYTIDHLKYDKDSEDQTELVFSREDGLLMDHPITRGRDASERINRIITFTGTSIKGPPGSVPFLKLSDTAMDVLPPDRKASTADEPPPDHKEVSATGRSQGLAFELGKGRVVVLADAAMLTAQVASRGFRFGMNVSGTDNRQLALNIMHWLSRLLK